MNSLDDDDDHDHDNDHDDDDDDDDVPVDMLETSISPMQGLNGVYQT